MLIWFSTVVLAQHFAIALLTLVTGAALVCMGKRRAIGHWLLTLALDIYTRAIMVMAIVCWLCTYGRAYASVLDLGIIFLLNL